MQSADPFNTSSVSTHHQHQHQHQQQIQQQQQQIQQQQQQIQYTGPAERLMYAPQPTYAMDTTQSASGGDSTSMQDGLANSSQVDHLTQEQTLEVAKYLLKFCNIHKEVKNIRQCTSSYFVLLYQRLFDCTLQGIDQPPNTIEKKLRNISLVLDELRRRGIDVDTISAEEVVRLNEDHISRLIMVFLRIALILQEQQQLQQPAQGHTALPYGYTLAEVPPPADELRFATAMGSGDTGYSQSGDMRPAAAGASADELREFSSAYEDGEVYDEETSSVIPTSELVKNWQSDIVIPPVEPPSSGQRPYRTHHLETADIERRCRDVVRELDRSSSLSSASRRGARPVARPHEPAAAAVQAHYPRQRPTPDASLVEPPLSATERRVLAQRPVRLIDSDARDRKIEYLRAAKFLTGMQSDIRRQMRQNYDGRITEMRENMKTHMTQAQRDKQQQMSHLREENEKYKRAYEAVMNSAANGRRVPQSLMSRNTARLAEFYEASVKENQRMVNYLEAEQARRNRQELVSYAKAISAWQQKSYAT